MKTPIHMLSVVGLALASCATNPQETPEGPSATPEETTFMQSWVNEANERRAEGQYMGYYSKQAYYRSLRPHGFHGSCGH